MKGITHIILAILINAGLSLSAQVAINTDGSMPAASAMLDVQSTTKGMLLPRLTNTERDAIASPVTGLIIFNTQYETLQVYDGSSWVLITEGNCGKPFYDAINDQYYETIIIGTQCWMAENLASTKYNDGTDIPLVTSGTAWGYLTTPGYCWHNNNVANADIYGALYNWYAVETGLLCPSGWHIPTDSEWTVLENYLIINGYNFDGSTMGDKIAKSLAAGFDWLSSGSQGVPGSTDHRDYRNKSGFRALPGGYRLDGEAEFSQFPDIGSWWSAMEVNQYNARRHYLQSHNYDLISSSAPKGVGLSVRCLRD